MSAGAWVGAWVSREDAALLELPDLPGAVAGADLHVTLGYLNRPAKQLHRRVRECLRDYLAGEIAAAFPVRGQISGWATFLGSDTGPEPEPDHHVYLVTSAALDVVSRRIRDAFPNLIDATYGWTPHITIHHGQGLPVWWPERRPVVFDRLFLVWGGDHDLIQRGDR